MSEETISAGAPQIIASIQADAEVQVQRSKTDAERAGQMELKKVQRQADTVRKEVLAKAEESAAKARARELATAKTEARRILLAARETLIAQALGQIEEALKALRADTGRYRTSLLHLAGEAIPAVGCDEVVLKVSKGEEAVVDGAFLEELAAGVRASAGRRFQVDLCVEERDLGGGCVAESVDGRVVFDNTFRRRLERAMPGIRAAIVKESIHHDG